MGSRAINMKWKSPGNQDTPVKVRPSLRLMVRSRNMPRLNNRPISSMLINLSTLFATLMEFMQLFPKYLELAVSDGKRIEVKTHQLFLRDRATGLCGDLNGEWSADLRSAKKCVVPKHKLAAVSFMIEYGKCQGIPQQEKSELQRYEQRCVRKTELPTKVTQIFSRYLNSQWQPEQRHLIEERYGKTCFSKELVRVCSRSYPKQVVKASWICLSGW